VDGGVERVVPLSGPGSQVGTAAAEAGSVFDRCSDRSANRLCTMSGPVGGRFLIRGCSPWPLHAGQVQQQGEIGWCAPPSVPNRLNS